MRERLTLKTCFRVVVLGLQTAGTFPYGWTGSLLKFSWPLLLWSVLVQSLAVFTLHLSLTEHVEELGRSGDIAVVDIITILSSMVGESSMAIGNLLLLIKSSEIAKCLNRFLDLGKKRVVATDRGALLPLFSHLLVNVTAVGWVYASRTSTETLPCFNGLPSVLLAIFGHHSVVLLFAFVTLALSRDLVDSVEEALTPPPSGGPQPRAGGAHLVVAGFLLLEKQVWKVRRSLPGRCCRACYMNTLMDK